MASPVIDQTDPTSFNQALSRLLALPNPSLGYSSLEHSSTLGRRDTVIRVLSGGRPTRPTIVKMEYLSAKSANVHSTKTKAVEDARQMQASVVEECKKSSRDPPNYLLLELIGKGSFGRVYKA